MKHLKTFLLTLALAAFSASAQKPVISPMDLPPAEINQVYNIVIWAYGATSWAVASGALPPGMGLDDSMGDGAFIKGTPTQAGIFNFTLTASNASGTSEPVAFSLKVCEKSEIVSIAISPNVVVVPKGSTQLFEVDVVFTGCYSNEYLYTLSGNKHTGTTLTRNGTNLLLSVALGEWASTLTIKVTALHDMTKTHTATVTVGKTYTVNNLASWNAAVAAINSFGDGSDTIKIAGNIICEKDLAAAGISYNVAIIGETNADGTPKYAIRNGGLGIDPDNYCRIENIIVENAQNIGISITAKNKNAVIKINNCIVRNCTMGGIDVNGPAAMQLTISNCNVSDSKDGNGIYISGKINLYEPNNITVHDCVVNNSGATGIFINSADNINIYDCTANKNGFIHYGEGYGFCFGGTENVTVNNCTATDNKFDGFHFRNDYSPSDNTCKISNSVSTGNWLNGFNTFYSGSHLLFTNCMANKNGINGFCCGGSSSTVNNCTAIANGWNEVGAGNDYGYGFCFNSTNIITNSSAANNKVGYYDSYQGNIINCTFSNNEKGIEGCGLMIYNSVCYANDTCDLALQYSYGLSRPYSRVYNTVYASATDTLYNGDKYVSYYDCLTADPKLQGRTANGGYTDNRNKIAYYSLGEGSSATGLADKSVIDVTGLLSMLPSDEWYKNTITEDYMNNIMRYDQLGNEREFNGDRFDAGAVSGEGNVNIKIKKSVLSYSPKKAANYGKSSILFYGNGFDEYTKIWLKKQGVSDIVQDTIVTNELGNKCTAVFNFHNKSFGKWDIVVDFGDTIITVKNGLEIEQYIEPKIEIELIVSEEAVRRAVGGKHLNFTPCIVKYRNLGNAEVYNVPIIIEFETNKEYAVNISEQWKYIVPDGLNMDSISRIDTLINPFTDRLHTYIAPVIPHIEPYGTGYLSFFFRIEEGTFNEDFEISVTALKPMLVTNPEAFEGFRSGNIALRSGSPCGLTAGETFSECTKKAAEIGIEVGFEIINAVIPGMSCFKSAADAGCKAGFDLHNSQVSTGQYVGNLAWDITTTALDCITEFVPATKVAKSVWKVIKVAKTSADIIKYAGLANDMYDNCKDKEKRKRVRLVGSVDPNDKIGPVSASGSTAFNDRTDFTYVINFENDPEKASAPAQEVWITDTLDLNVFDINTFEAGIIMIGGKVIETPFEQQNYKWTVDMRPEMDLITEVSLKLDKQKGIATWYFASIDPATGLLTEDALAGFLPPNDDKGSGQGFVLYSIKLKNGLADDVVVANKASIVFDNNAAIVTNEWINKKDIVAPTSAMLQPVEKGDGLVELKWQGADNEGGSGVYCYDVYMKRENGAYEKIFAQTSATSAPFTVEAGVKYAFYTLATDNAGNVERKTNIPDITIPQTSGIKELQLHKSLVVSLVPNPANTQCTVSFEVEKQGNITVTLSNMLGARLMNIYDGHTESGKFSQTFDTASLPAGIYMVSIHAGNTVVTEKLVKK